MTNALTVTVLETGNDLSNEVTSASLRKALLLVDQVEDGTVFSVLHDDVQPGEKKRQLDV